MFCPTATATNRPLLADSFLDPIKEVSEKPQAGQFVPLNQGQNFAQRFMEGMVTARIDIKVKGQDGLFGVFLLGPDRKHAMCGNFPEQFPVLVSGDPDETGDERLERLILVTSHIDKITDDLTGNIGVWLAVGSQSWLKRVVPPLGWRTGHPSFDRRIDKRDHSPEFIEHYANLNRDLGGDDLEAIREKLVTHTRVVVSQHEIIVAFDAPGDELFEHVETIIGPFNTYA